MKITVSKIGLVLFSLGYISSSFDSITSEVLSDTYVIFSIIVFVTSIFGAVLGIVSLFSQRVLKYCIYTVLIQMITIIVSIGMVLISGELPGLGALVVIMLIYGVLYALMLWGFVREYKLYSRRLIILSKSEILWFDGEKLV